MLRIAGRTMKARLSPASILRDARLWRAPQDEELTPPSLRAQRSNPDCRRGGILDCFAALAMTEWGRTRNPANAHFELSTHLRILAACSARVLLAFCLSMIFSENRFTLFRIMLYTDQ